MASEQAFHFNSLTDELEIGPQQKTIALIPHFTAALSFLGSLYIVIDICRDRKKIQKNIYHRLMLGMSVSDLLASFFLFLSSWPIPEGTEGVYGAVGNLQSCSVQGFFVQTGVATFLYTAYLSVYYLLMMRYHWKERDFKLLEKIWHGSAIGLSVGTAVAAAYLKLYNNANLWCWIAPLPLDCLNSSKNDGVSTCERGDDAYIYRIAFYFFWLWMAVIVVAVCMSMVFWTVWKQRQAMQKWNPDKNQTSKRGDSLVQAVAVQSCLYIGAFLLTAIFPSLVRMFQAKWNCTTTFYPLTLMTVTLFPLQGFWNFFIYMRPRFNTARKEHPNWSFSQALRYTLGRTLGFSIPEDDKDYKLGLDTTEETTATTTNESYMSHFDTKDGIDEGGLKHEQHLDKGRTGDSSSSGQDNSTSSQDLWIGAAEENAADEEEGSMGPQ